MSGDLPQDAGDTVVEKTRCYSAALDLCFSACVLGKVKERGKQVCNIIPGRSSE